MNWQAAQPHHQGQVGRQLQPQPQQPRQLKLLLLQRHCLAMVAVQWHAVGPGNCNRLLL